MDIITPPETPRYLPPQKEDVLFCNDLSDWWNNAYVNWGGKGYIEFGYREGYRRGAALLTQYVNENRREADSLVYPIIFLYRHHIELALKNLIVQGQRLRAQIDWPLDATTESPKGHNLSSLWEKVRPMLNAIYERAGWEELDASEEEGIGNYIAQLMEFDPGSTNSRYPLSKTGTLSLPANLERVNIRHFAEKIERLASCLDDIYSALSGLAWECDMTSDGDYA